MSPYASFAYYGAAGTQLALSVVGGLLLGNYLDGRLSTGPWLAVAGLALGFVGGMLNLIRIVGHMRDRDDRGDGGKEG
jgi:F0F1-type ATP synthase assembly protein I